MGSVRDGGKLAAALAVNMSVVQEHAQWWNPDLEPQVEALQSPVAEGVEGVLRQESSPEEEKMHTWFRKVA